MRHQLRGLCLCYVLSPTCSMASRHNDWSIVHLVMQKCKSCLRSCHDAISGGTPSVNDSSLSCKKCKPVCSAAMMPFLLAPPLSMTAAFHAKSASLFAQLP